MKRPPPTVWVWAFGAYAYAATVVCAAWFLRRMAQTDGREVALGVSLLWSALVYGGWIPVAVLIGVLFRRAGHGPVRGFVLLMLFGVIAVPGNALYVAWIDQHFAPAAGDLLLRFEHRIPVDIALYTALAAACVAARLYIDGAELARALAEAREALTRRAASAPAPARLMVAAGARRVPVDLAEVECFASAGNYVVVHWDGREGLLRETLQALERRLDPQVFARSHRSTIVNLGKIASAASLSDGSWRLTTVSGVDLVASRTHRDAILQRLGR